MTIFSKIKTTIFALGLLAISTASNAAFITYSTDVNLGTSNRSTSDYTGGRYQSETISRSFSLANFDTSLGTLNSVFISLQNVNINGNQWAGFRDQTDGNVSGYAEFYGRVEVAVNNGSAFSLSTALASNGRTSCSESAVFALTQDCDVSKVISLNFSSVGRHQSPLYTSLFTVPGMTNYSVTAFLNHLVSETDDAGYVDYSGFSAGVSAVASVTYNYTASASNDVNTPALSGLFGLMMFSIFYLGRRKN